MKKFKSTEIAQLKRTAQNVYPKLMRKHKILQQIEDLNAELTEISEEVESWEAPIRKLTGGFTTEDLIERVVEDTGKVSKDGVPIKTTKYVLKYPDTIVPPADEETTEVVDNGEGSDENNGLQ